VEVPQSILDELVTWIGEGKTLRAFCRQEGYPSKSTIYSIIEADSVLSGLIARAREEGHDAIAEECLEIADTEKDANIGKLRVWTRLQLLAKWNPKKYGDRVALDHGGEVAIKRVVADV
jgi:hypothetical protein